MPQTVEANVIALPHLGRCDQLAKIEPVGWAAPPLRGNRLRPIVVFGEWEN
jgi:hypothetical protein